MEWERHGMEWERHALNGHVIRMKQVIKVILRILLTPWRKLRTRRDGVADLSRRKEYSNDALLGMVCSYLAQGKEATIIVKGYSMRPFLEHERDKVILTAPKRGLEVGDAVLAELSPGHYVLHRIIELDAEKVTLMGDGNIRGVEHCRLRDVRGIVTHYVRPKRELAASDPGLQRRIRLWRRLLPIRRYLLLIYKSTV